MIEQLTSEQRKRLEDSFLSAFSPDGLRIMTRRELGLQLEHEVNVAQGLKYVVSDLVAVALAGGWLDQLVRSARRQAPGNPKLRNAAIELQVIEVLEPVIETPGQSHAALLEKTVKQRAPYLKWTEFLAKFSALGSMVCRIEYPAGTAQGTGWLVGPDLLLTAYHVVEDLDKKAVSAADAICRFDYTVDGNPGELPGTVCGLAKPWLLASSRYSAADLAASASEPAADELDYALLRLNTKIGEATLPDSKVRGWVQISESAPVVMADDVLLIPQHPKGRPLELTFGRVLAYNAVGNRMRYDANTEKGSSGSPCFDVSLSPFGVHHAGGPSDKLKYNQCVPIRRIIAHVKTTAAPVCWSA